jgi:cell division protein FtsQ
MSPSARVPPTNRRVAAKAAAPTNVRASTSGGAAHGGAKKDEPWDPDLLWRRLRLAGRILIAVLVIVAGGAGAIGARRYVTSSPRFGLKELKVEGARRLSSQEIQRLAGIEIGQNVVDMDLDALRGRIEKNPWIERAQVARRLPASLTIEIVEHEAAALVTLPTGTFLATPAGVLFKRVEPGDPDDLPLITGINPDDATGDREATAQLVKRALELSAEIERVGVFGGRVEELHVESDGGLSAVVGKRAVRLVFGRAPYRGKVRLGATIEAELTRRGARPTVVFLDDDTHPDRIVVRLVSALPPAQVTVDGEPKTPGPTAQVSKKKGGAP